MNRFLLNQPPTRHMPAQALIYLESPPVVQFDRKYLHLKSDLLWGDIVQFKRVNSLKIGSTVIVEFKVQSDHTVQALAPGFSAEIHSHFLYFLAEETYGFPATVVQLTVLARRRVACEQ